MFLIFVIDQGKEILILEVSVSFYYSKVVFRLREYKLGVVYLAS